MKLSCFAISIAIGLWPAAAGAQLQEMRQTIFGMD